MRKQRSRRAILRTVGAIGFTGVAGCLGKGGVSIGDGSSDPITILAAGSLTDALSNGLAPALDTPVEIETHGSARIARMIDDGVRDPDIVVVADTALFDQPLSLPWHSVFTSNALVVAYNPSTEGGKRLVENTKMWHELLAGDIDLGRTDPEADPLGYRTLFMLELAARYYEVDDLTSTLLTPGQIYPESSLISRFETDSIDAAIAYRNMAIEREYDYIDLPDPIDLSNPEHTEDWYSTVSYTLPDGTEVEGDCISYGGTARTMTDDVLSVFDRLIRGAYLERHGFILRESFPIHYGDVPERIETRSFHSANRSTTEQGSMNSSV